MKTGIIIIDPGHGGMKYAGGSDIKYTGDPEQKLTSDISIFHADESILEMVILTSIYPLQTGCFLLCKTLPIV